MSDSHWLTAGMKMHKVHDAEENFASRTVYADSARDAAEIVAREWVEQDYSYVDYGDEFEVVTVVDGERITVGFSVDFTPVFYTSVAGNGEVE